MSVTISLFDLANLSISHPEPGMVNFLALHSLLHAILKTLGIQHVQTEEPELFKLLDSTGRAPLASSPSPLQEQPLRPEPRGARSRGPYLQLEEKLRDVEQQVQELRRLPTGMELLESSKKHGKSVHDMWNLLQLRKNTETNKEGVDKAMSLMEEMVQEINDLKNFKNTVEDRMTDIDKDIDMVTTHISLINELLNKTPEQLQKFVSWKMLQNTLVDTPHDRSDDIRLFLASEDPDKSPHAPDVKPETSYQPMISEDAGSKPAASKDKPASANDIHSSEKSLRKLETELMDSASFLVTEDEAQLHPDIALALQHIRHVTDTQPALIQRVTVLEKALADLVSGMEIGKGTDLQTAGKTSSHADDVKSKEDIKSQISSLRDMVQNIDEELKEMRKFQQTSSKDRGQMQKQLDKLGPVLEKIMSSSCALLGMSLGLETEVTCPVCSLDVSQDASNLCQRFQKLQNTVNSLVDSTEGNVKDQELQNQLQNHILQLQGECERLNMMTSQLLQEDQLHQKNIEALNESLNRLERKCSDGNISRTQFDAVTDQINKMIQGILNKICMQEKDWGSILEQLTAEMDCKLNRVELDPLKKQLENRWKSIRKHLQKHKGFEQEGAAALKKQLISHFHCLSCDRPLDIKMTSAPNVISFPIPTYPVHGYPRSHWQDIDHSRWRNRGVQSHALHDRTINSMQRLHMSLCRQIESVQTHIKGSVKAVSPFMRPLLHMGCPIARPAPRKMYESLIKSERISELMESFPPNARSCGGSHTLTSGYHRRGLKSYEHHLSMLLDEEHSNKAESVMASVDSYPPKARSSRKLPSLTAKDVNKCKPARCPSRKSSSARLTCNPLCCPHLPSLKPPGSVMPKEMFSEPDCQFLTEPSLPSPCSESETSSEQPSLSNPSTEQPLDVPVPTGAEPQAPVKSLNI
ncbi:glutamine-rich protein 2-like isoform X2 [Stegostoma tigrinum]|uniref:glutamine-rich protein 2-like isoform X2 n=1 Tax=Stegostoma tigrinum TaxID=3053191 RepID=UPI002870495D|nr:glutamine-rich protein 2-like isoform X2 [Stegostoma tigrinum]